MFFAAGKKDEAPKFAGSVRTRLGNELGLIKDGELHAHVPAAVRRKLRLADVLTYREQLRARRNRFITESSTEFAGADADDVAELLAEAKRTR